jgi:sulfite exporter TauE/SafE/copper chaperone CopZ
MTYLDAHDAVTLVLKIEGMHCRHCEVAIERQLAMLPGVERVEADFETGTARIVQRGAAAANAVQAAVEQAGYRLKSSVEKGGTKERNSGRDFAEIGAAFLVVAGVAVAVSKLGLLPNVAISNNIGFGIAFAFGLVASVSSCMAVTGGLLIALAARYNDAYTELTAFERLRPHLYFNVGRIVSYALLGGAIGALGSALMLSPRVTSALTIAASLIMIVLGLRMLRLLPSAGKFFPALSKSLAHRIHDFGARNVRGGAFLLGALTFFLPCGFTQALQLYALTKGSALAGALTMLAFALGTLPALLSLSALSSFAVGGVQKHFLRFAGAAVIVLGVFNIQYGLVLVESSSAPVVRSESGEPAQVAAGRQIVDMRIDGLEYFPNRFVVRQGIPVEWRIDARNAAGCGRILLAPRLGIRTFLAATGTTVIGFTPERAGDFAFNCGMGMMTPGSKFTVLPDASG